jgi:glycosyltransferase involved in cell wall biosynthesis
MREGRDRRISVLIPCYNHARFVGEAIGSVAAQRWPDLELIVVDDGSSDESPRVVERALQEAAASLTRVVFIEQENTGTHGALARAIAESTGDVLTILNSDDRYHPDRLERIMAAAPLRGDFLAFSSVTLIDAAGSPMAPESETARGYRHALYEASRCPTVGFGLLRNNFSVTTGNFVFTRSLYEKIGGFRSYRLAHDWDFLLQALWHVEPVFVPEPLLDYRTHGTNTRHQLENVALEEGQEILRRYFALAEDGSPANPLAPCEENWPVFFDLFVSRYNSWFGWRTIREWVEDEERPSRRRATGESWRPWDASVTADSVEDCYYLVDPGIDPARRAALAIAREVLVSAAHPLEFEPGEGPDALASVFERHAHPMPRLRLPPWRSPVGATSPRDDTEAGGAPGGSGATRASRRWQLGPVLRSRSLGRLRSVATDVRNRRIIARSRLVHADFYREQCRSRGLHARDPVRHYLRTGAALGLDPNPLFSTRYYLARNPDVAGRVNPLVHYLFHGDAEGRKPHSLFDPMWYRWAHPDVAQSGLNTLAHYLAHGAGEGRRAHPRFDPDFYVKQLGTPLDRSVDLLSHYAVHGIANGIPLNRGEAIRGRLEAGLTNATPAEQARVRDRDRDLPRRIRACPAFDTGMYRRSWGGEFENVADAARHFLEVGAAEGIPLGAVDRIEEWLHGLEDVQQEGGHPAHAYLGREDLPGAGAGHRVTLYVSTEGNAFFREMACHLAEGFRAAGAEARVADERAEIPLPDDTRRDHVIIVAPHEFFQLGDGPKRLSFDLLRRASIWSAEQPGSIHFSMCLWYARFARRVLDANPLTAIVWEELGLPSRAFPLGWVECFDDYADAAEIRSDSVRHALAPDARSPISVHRPIEERPLDVFFNGVSTDRRAEFFAANAALFADLRCALYMPQKWHPVSENLPSALDARDATALAQRAKISLNLHRSELPYFEWHRIVVRGMWQKSVVVTEPSLRIPGFEPGEHYIECPLDAIPRKIEWLLRTKAGREELTAVRDRAFDALRSRYSLRAIAAAFLAEESEEGES